MDIHLANNRGVAVIDDADAHLLGKPRLGRSSGWYLHSNGYAAARRGGKIVYMHRLILGYGPDDPHIDHRDGNKLNNRRSNLRPGPQWLNQANRGPQKGRYKGVWFRNDTARWSARIRMEGKYRVLGCFDTAEEAALAYNEAARKAFGGYAYLNRIEPKIGVPDGC
jgi:hypothetical protein